MAHSKPAGVIPIAAAYLVLLLMLPPWYGPGQSAGRQADEGEGETTATEIDRTRIADYDIQVRLDTDQKTLAGRETITWHNAESEPASELKFHLYMNAFRSADTMMMASLGGWSSRDAGWIDVTSVRLPGGGSSGEEVEQAEEAAPGVDLTSRVSVDETIMTVPLPEPVQPGGRLRVEIEFEVKLPRLIMRSGYSGEYYFIGQWFPKVAVYASGRWLCPQYQRHTEFFSDFGRYRVEITVPRNHYVGATGTLESTRNRSQEKTLVYNAYPVHDFAWSASPHFRPVERKLTYTVSGATRSIDLLLLMQRDRLGKADVYVESVERALAAFGEAYGAFPYPRLTVIDPAQGRGLNSGGMEYPMLITGGSSWLETYVFPGERPIEGVTIHEFGHQYWYGAVASNEFDEPWLDEGITSYTTDKVIDSYAPFGARMRYPKILSDTLFTVHPFLKGWRAEFSDFRELVMLGRPHTSVTQRRSEYLNTPQTDAITAKAYRTLGGNAYLVSAYSKPALFFYTLEGMLGEGKVAEILKEYYRRYRFRQPSGEEFRALASEVAGEDLEWFFSQVLDGIGLLDYAVEGLSSNEEGGEYRSRAFLVRAGAVTVPQIVRLTLADGRTTDIPWQRHAASDEQLWMEDFEQLAGMGGTSYRLQEGRNGRWLRIELRSPQQLTAVQIDPRCVYLLDANLANNSYRMQPETAAATHGEIAWTRLMGRWLHGISVFN